MSPQKRFKLQTLPTFLLCLTTATLLWLLTMLGKDYTTEVSIPVSFTNIPADRVVNSELPESIIVGVHGRGFGLLKLQSNVKKNAVVFDVERMTTGKNRNSVHINSQEIRESIGAQISAPLSVTSLHPETIGFTLSEVANKSVPIRINHDITYKKQFTLKNKIIAEPSHIIITGARDIIDSIEYVETELVEGKNINSNIDKSVKLQPIPHITYNKSHITVRADVEQTTGAERTAGVRIQNLPKNISMTLFPEEIKLSYEVGLSKYDTSLKDNFDFVVDFKEITEERNYLQIKVHRIPEYIENLSYSPQRVEYIIEER